MARSVVALMNTPVVKVVLLGLVIVAAGLFAKEYFLVTGAAKGSAQAAFEQMYKSLTASDRSPEQVLSDLDMIIRIGTTEPGELLTYVHELADPVAHELAAQAMALDKGDKRLEDWVHSVMHKLPRVQRQSTHALLRRLIVAAVAKYWLQHDSTFTMLEESALLLLFKELYVVHRRGAVSKAIMDYLHISKSGGTSWCHVAELNGCKTQKYDFAYVCQIKAFDDKVRWLNMSFHKEHVPVHKVPKYVLRRFSKYGTLRPDEVEVGCAARHRTMHENDWNYFSNEYTVLGGQTDPMHAHLCKEFFNAMLFRDPNKRLVSHMKFIMWTMSGERGYNDSALFDLMYHNRSSTFWQQLGPAVVDNYYIRSLLGEYAYHLPVGAITQHHMNMALQVLLQYDLLMVLEQSMTTRSLIMYYGAGWVHTLEEVHDKDSSVREAIFDTSRYIPKDVAWLLEQQGMDNQLYKLAQVASALDPVVFTAAKRLGMHPLPELAGARGGAAVQCGLLRGNNASQALKALDAADDEPSAEHAMALAEASSDAQAARAAKAGDGTGRRLLEYGAERVRAVLQAVGGWAYGLAVDADLVPVQGRGGERPEGEGPRASGGARMPKPQRRRGLAGVRARGGQRGVGR